jgi:hypothetical protein
MKTTQASIMSALTVAFLSVAQPLHAAEVIVYPGNLDGWQEQESGTSTVTFVDGPAGPPCGSGSAEFRIDAGGASGAQLRNTNYNGVLLSSLTELSYSTFIQENNNEQAPYIILSVDTTGDGVSDDLLFFEPVYQDVTFFPTNPQGDVTVDTWQTWDALNGAWYALSGAAGSGPGANVVSLDEYIAEFPNATIVNSSTGQGGVRLVTGFGGPADWGNFVGNADCFAINGTTFDFEADNDSDNDGVPNDEDHCPNSDLRAKVDVGNGPTNINNDVDVEGCSIQDLVNECADHARNHGAYVSCIAHLANDLRKAGVLTDGESTALKNGAAKSSVGKKSK